ncbi:uncharacterized protein LOC121905078 [Scomber scombrus]
MYPDDRLDPAHQNPAYQGEVDLQDTRMTDGTLVFTFKQMNHTFEGKYECYVFQNGYKILIGTINLKAVEVQEQKAVLGEPVRLIYRCDINNTSGIKLTKPNLNQSEYVFMYRDNRSDPAHQNPAYQGKVDLQDRRMTDGTLVFTF